MDIDRDWKEIVDVFNTGIKASKHAAIASVDANGCPTVTPIGFTFLNDNKSAYYFEQYSEAMPVNYEHNRNVCLLIVNTSTLFWAKSLFKGRFLSYPGIRLYGVVGDCRQATTREKERLSERVGRARLLKGSKLIWSGLETVRDIKLNSVRPIKYPKMMEHLLASSA